MKTAAKVFIIISMIIGAILIFPLVIGIIALNKMNDENVDHDSYVVWSVLTMIFCSLLGGLFMLLADTEISSSIKSSDNVVDAKVEDASNSSLDEIKKAKELLDSGAITEEEFNQIKQKALNK